MYAPRLLLLLRVLLLLLLLLMLLLRLHKHLLRLLRLVCSPAASHGESPEEIVQVVPARGHRWSTRVHRRKLKMEAQIVNSSSCSGFKR